MVDSPAQPGALRPRRFATEVDPGPVQIQARKVHFDLSGIPLEWIPGHPVASTMINLFNVVNVSAVNFGGLLHKGNPKIPLTLVNENQLEFSVPAGARTGPAYVMALNPPFIPFSSTTGDPQGGFTLIAP